MNTETQQTERELLLERATQLGLEFPNNIKTTKLKAMVNAKLNDEPLEDDEEDEEEEVVTKPEKKQAPSVPKKKVLTKAEKIEIARKKASALVRVIVHNNNIHTKEHEGVLICVGNRVVGDIKKYIPFGVEWHVPKIIMDALEDRKYQAFKTVVVKGIKKREGYLAKEFTIEKLPNLTKEELEKLAEQQAANRSIENS